MLIIDAQARVGQRLSQELGEAPPIALFGARIKLLALIDVEQKGRRLRLTELLEATLGGVDQMGKGSLALEKLDPAKLQLHTLWIGRRKLPGVKETIDQRL